MSDLYTSQVHLKRLLAGQATAAFTPLTIDAKKYIKPEFVPGMGALNEDDEGRLQCGFCGEWHAWLGAHLRAKHRAIGGAQALRDALDIPKNRPLFSSRVRAEARGRLTAPRRLESLAAARSVARDYARPRKGPKSLAMRNETDTCPGQLQARITALHGKLGRNVTASDFAAEYGPALLSTVKVVFGSWGNAKAMAGLSATPHKTTETNLVVESLRTWYEAHGDLPTALDAQTATRAPLIPSYATILRALGASSWASAMRSAGERLGIVSRRFDGSDAKALKVSREAVLAALRKWHSKYGDLPTLSEAQQRFRRPEWPAHSTVARLLGSRGWKAAMRSAVENLGIKSERYGSPASRTA